MAVSDPEELPTEPTARVTELAELSPARAALSLAWPGIVEQLVRAAGQATVFAFIGHLGAVATAAAGAGLQFTFLLFPVFQSLSMSISLPSAAEGVLFSVGLIFIGGLVLRFGTEAFAAHQIVIQLESISFLPCIGFSTAAASLVGQSLGLRDPERAMRVGWAAARMAMLWTAAIGLLMVLFPAALLALFTSDPGVVAAVIGSTIIIGLSQPAQAVVFALAGSLRGAGDTRYTLRITAFNWIVVRLPLCVLLGGVLGLGLAGVWLALAIDYFIRAGLMALRFRSGAWQRLRY